MSTTDTTRSLADISILYVEDDLLTLRSIGRMMGRRVREVRLAANGLEALEAFADHPADIVVTDIEMPGLGGLGLIEKLRHEHDFRNPIVVLTAYKSDQYQSDLADLHLYKPINTQELFASIEALVPKIQCRHS